MAQELWRPATVDEVREIVRSNLEDCDERQLATYRAYAIEPHYSGITRYGKDEQVVVVAKKGNEVIYWEDVEEGFNTSPVASDGRILKHWCNQDRIGIALNAWIAN